MRSRIVVLVPLLVACAGLTVAARAEEGVDLSHPIAVDGVRVASAQIERRGSSTAAAGNIAIETRWLRGELAERGAHAPAGAAQHQPRRFAPAKGDQEDRDDSAALRTVGGRTAGVRGELGGRERLRDLRAAVADQLALGVRDAQRFAWIFDSFHLRWRERTACVPEFHDPVMDRCANHGPSSAGTCRWMGELTLCRVNAARPTWLLLGPGGDRRKARSLAAAARLAFAAYRDARDERAAAAREAADEAARVARAAAIEAGQEAATRALRARMASPKLAPAALDGLQSACRRYRRDVELYQFGAMQDPEGWAYGVSSARKRFAAALRAAPLDSIDRGKAQALETRLRSDEALDDAERFADLARGDQAEAARLGLSCLAVPGG
jgi:hypothetical protein